MRTTRLTLSSSNGLIVTAWGASGAHQVLLLLLLVIISIITMTGVGVLVICLDCSSCRPRTPRPFITCCEVEG